MDDIVVYGCSNCGRRWTIVSDDDTICTCGAKGTIDEISTEAERVALEYDEEMCKLRKKRYDDEDWS